ncbi:MAG TPA: hypothetical protein VK506_00375 [Conexibacter sp.]|nr:hypothetical protein [Conexibacter sp.]
MRAVRDLGGQLVERRLWPVALVLVVALVAVPLVLAKSPTPDAGAEAAADAPPVAAVAAAADLRTPGEPVVSVAEEVERAPLRGRLKNPFRQQHVPKQSSEGSGGLIVLLPPRFGGGGGGELPGGTGGTGGSGGAGEEQPPETYRYASIDVRFGRAGSPLREIRDVPRLTPLPNAANPIVIFIGMRGDHETAVFMLSTDVHAQGDGRCTPSVSLCEAIELRQDDVAFLDVRAEDGTVTQYELDLVHVEVHETTSKGKASGTYARSSRADAPLGHVGRASETRAVPQASAGATSSAPALAPLP